MAKASDPAGPSDQGPGRTDDPPATLRKSAAGGRILIVDDDVSVLETMADLLDCVGFRPVQACNASDALLLLRQDAAVDLLITDLTMPGADGIALIRQARDIKPNLPVILMTGYAEMASSVATFAGGNFHVLRKPVEGARLIRQLELLMNTADNS